MGATLDVGGRVQDSLNRLVKRYGFQVLTNEFMMRDCLMPVYAETEYSVLTAAARLDVLRHLSAYLAQWHGRTLKDHLKQLDKGILPDQLPQMDLADLGPDLDDACRWAARFLEDRAFQNPSAVAPDAYDWAVGALVTAVRYELAYYRKVRSEVDLSDLSNLWQLWLPR